MKKNVMMRVASIMLVLVLMSSSVISGTFAKYTTQDSGKDEARVAKWGVEVQVIGNLYGDTYKDQIVRATDDTGDNIRVQSADKAADVVAPGTKNVEGFTFSLKGQPEVDGIVTTTMKIQNIFLKAATYGLMIPVDAGVVTAENFDEFAAGELYIKDGDAYTVAANWTNTTYYTLEDKVVFYEDYYPVVYNLTGNTNTTGAINGDSLKKAADAIATNLELNTVTTDGNKITTYTGTKTFDTNYNLASWKVDGLTLTWAWAFGDVNKDGDVGDGATDAAWTDGADTILGNLMAAKLNDGEHVVDGEVVKLDGANYVALEQYTDYCLETQFSIDITATQVD